MIERCARVLSGKWISKLVVVGSLLSFAACGNSNDEAGPPDEAVAISDAQPDADSPALWKPIQEPVEYVPTPQAIASLIIRFDLAVIRPPQNKRFSLMLPGGELITVVLTKFEPIADSRFVWRGVIEGQAGSDVRFAVVNETLVGDIMSPRGKLWAIRTVQPGIAVVETLDRRKFPREEGSYRPDKRASPESPTGLRIGTEGEGGPPQPERRAFDPRLLAQVPRSTNMSADSRVAPIAPTQAGPQYIMKSTTPAAEESDSIIDVMILYTAGAREYLSQPDGVQGKIDIIVSDANKSYTESGIHQRLVVVHAEETNYMENDDLYLDLLTLKANGNGEMNTPQLRDIKAKRLSYGADIVALLTRAVSSTNKNSCGWSGDMQHLSADQCTEAYSVVPANCAADQYSFPHELGHTMGADHNNVSNSQPFDYGQGLIAESKYWHTIMASPSGECETEECERILRWSNADPQFKYSEQLPDSQEMTPLEPTGNDLANNAKVLNQTRTYVAEFSNACK